MAYDTEKSVYGMVVVRLAISQNIRKVKLCTFTECNLTCQPLESIVERTHTMNVLQQNLQNSTM